MSDKVEQLTKFIQEKCLWQFLSRTWDREEAISGVIKMIETLQTGGQPVIETPIDKCHYADAKVLLTDINKAFSWFGELKADQLGEVLHGAEARLKQITITGSLNGELNHQLY
ncbi:MULTISPECIES: Fe-only/vanadium nitrogenase subunit delta [Paenibacillus]|uniref:nitrogenase n=1 Tax=Paenibacillus durus TaxID=44251 RepID=A0A089HP59_PAEDU|nr:MULTISPECIES: Fe-only/vanadium nitrogenase subunit delta [Paenibacillus]AIQ12505.1 nitrogenase vanadium-iron protein delta chain [Paenibacillus durus]